MGLYTNYILSILFVLCSAQKHFNPQPSQEFREYDLLDTEYHHKDTSSRYDLRSKVYGVNLGGWLVTEPWITPSLFEKVEELYGELPVDEYHLCSTLGIKAKTYLSYHWDTFYTEDDFVKIADLGLNLVRIPIGYWAFGLLPDDIYVQGQERYLDLAINWANKHNLSVQVGIHGLPGSQNGFDNSGFRTDSPQWLNTIENTNLTYKVVDYVLDKYGNMTGVHSIQVVNEPMGWLLNKTKLLDFYRFAVSSFKEKQLSAKLVLHDAFYSMESWNNFGGDFILDHHLYECFTDWQINYNFDEHLDNVRRQSKRLRSSVHPSIVGEFSGALDDCTKFLNGIGRGSRWEGTYLSNHKGCCDGKDDPENIINKDEIMLFLRQQFYGFEENSLGWIFWCWKTEGSIVWDMQRLAENNMLPMPLKKPSINLETENKNTMEVVHNESLAEPPTQISNKFIAVEAKSSNLRFSTRFLSVWVILQKFWY